MASRKDSLKNVSSQRKAYHGKSGHFEEDRQMCQCIGEKINERKPITGAIIQMKALDIAKKLILPTIEAHHFLFRLNTDTLTCQYPRSGHFDAV